MGSNEKNTDISGKSSLREMGKMGQKEPKLDKIGQVYVLGLVKYMLDGVQMWELLRNICIFGKIIRHNENMHIFTVCVFKTPFSQNVTFLQLRKDFSTTVHSNALKFSGYVLYVICCDLNGNLFLNNISKMPVTMTTNETVNKNRFRPLPWQPIFF